MAAVQKPSALACAAPNSQAIDPAQAAGQGELQIAAAEISSSRPTSRKPASQMTP